MKPKLDISENKKAVDVKETMKSSEVAILGGGCFWCTEAVFESRWSSQVVSVMLAESLKILLIKNLYRTFRSCKVIKITHDSKIISYEKILDIFGDCHDTTTLNRQGADVGTQYRSTIMYLNPSQQKAKNGRRIKP